MSTDSQEKPFKVAIIGAGIGGATAAFYLRDLFGPLVGISVFEQSHRIGGRIKSIVFGGKHFEAGASIFHEDNRYLMSFVRKFGLELESGEHHKTRLAIYDGFKELSFSTLQNYGLIARMRLLFRYGTSFISMAISTRNKINRFAHIYTLQADGRCFNTPAELLKAMDPEFLEMTKWTYGDWLTERERVPNLLKEELLYGLVSNNYCQDLNCHAFVGFITMATMVGSLNSVKNGNQQIPEKLIHSALEQNPEGSPKEFVHAQVTTISSDKDDKYRIQYRSHDTTETKEESFDYVIVAAPLHQKSSIQASSDIKLPSDTYVSMDVTAIAGDLKQSAFGVTTSSFKTGISPYILLTQTGYMQNNCLLRSLSGSLNPNIKNYVWFAFSEPNRMPNPEKTIPEKYIDPSGTETPLKNSWLAYPAYNALCTPDGQLGSFVLAPRLYYPNAIERAASCMEIAAIGGRNAALLIAADRREAGRKKSTGD